MPPIVSPALATKAAGEAAKALAAPAPEEAPVADQTPPPSSPDSGTEAAEPAAPAPSTTPTSEGPRSEDLPEAVRAAIAAGTLKAEDFQFLDPKWEPAYTRKLNAINRNVGRALDAAGFKLPEGVSVSDLIYKDDGKGFIELLNSSIAAGVKPLLDDRAQAVEDDRIRRNLIAAQADFPLVKKHYLDALKAVDSNEQLQQMALENGGQRAPWVLAGVATDLELQAKIGELKKAHETIQKLTLLLKTGKETSKTTPGAQPGDQAEAKPKISGFRDVRGIAAIAAGIKRDMARKAN